VLTVGLRDAIRVVVERLGCTRSRDPASPLTVIRPVFIYGATNRRPGLPTAEIQVPNGFSVSYTTMKRGFHQESLEPTRGRNRRLVFKRVYGFALLMLDILPGIMTQEGSLVLQRRRSESSSTLASSSSTAHWTVAAPLSADGYHTPARLALRARACDATKLRFSTRPARRGSSGPPPPRGSSTGAEHEPCQRARRALMRTRPARVRRRADSMRAHVPRRGRPRDGERPRAGPYRQPSGTSRPRARPRVLRRVLRVRVRAHALRGASQAPSRWRWQATTATSCGTLYRPRATGL
jgi:hypothetical protein